MAMKTNKLQILGAKLTKKVLFQKETQVKKARRFFQKVDEFKGRVEEFDVTHKLIS